MKCLSVSLSLAGTLAPLSLYSLTLKHFSVLSSFAIENSINSVGGCYLRRGAFDPGASGGPGRLPKTRKLRGKREGKGSVTPEMRVKYPGDSVKDPRKSGT